VSFLLHFTGPSFQQTVTLLPGTPAVVIGRDPGAAVYLPDTKRLISRRHVSIDWFPEGARILVLSSNGISTDLGDYFEGDLVTLGHGQSARLGPYTMLVAAADTVVDPDTTRFSGMGTRPTPMGPDTRSAGLDESPAPTTAPDPWAVLTSQTVPPSGATFPGAAAFAPAAPPTNPERLAVLAVCRGLGIAPPAEGVPFEWERFGRRVRQAVECLGEHIGARAEARRELQVEDGTRIGGGPVNPLKNGMPPADLVQYLLVLPDGIGGLAPTAQALRDAAVEARAHETSARLAAQALAEGAIHEFDPAKLRGTLLKGKLSMTSMVDNARLWDLYTTWHGRSSERLPEWSGHLFNRYYMAAYLRESERLRKALQHAPADGARH
jgi:predicted component of type VI protein secretion system